jgi:hypothetical protein
MRDFPTDLEHTINEIQILGEVFCQIEGYEENGAASYGLIGASLVHYQSAVSNLEKVVNCTSRSLEGASKTRKWLLVKAVLRKEEVRDLASRLETSKSLLHLVMTCYSLLVYPLVILARYAY